MIETSNWKGVKSKSKTLIIDYHIITFDIMAYFLFWNLLCVQNYTIQTDLLFQMHTFEYYMNIFDPLIIF